MGEQQVLNGKGFKGASSGDHTPQCQCFEGLVMVLQQQHN
jgi:hypothetical protein